MRPIHQNSLGGSLKKNKLISFVPLLLVSTIPSYAPAISCNLLRQDSCVRRSDTDCEDDVNLDSDRS